MEKRATSRGFNLINFIDANGEICSIQESSAIGDEETGNLLWLGCDEINHKYFTAGLGWQDVKAPVGNDGEIANTRMHLNQQQVKALLPILKKFAKTGGL